MNFLEAEVLQWVTETLLILTRVGAFFLAAPVFGSKLFNARARLFLALLIALLLKPHIQLPSLPDALSLQLWVMVLHEVVIGVTAAFAMQLAFQVAVLAGQYIAMKMGLGFASMNDPSNGVSITVISQYYLMLITLLFIAGDGHLLLIRLLAESFVAMPLGSSVMSAKNFWLLVSAGSWLFSAALLIALPVLASLMIVNIAFGVMARSAPQMNIFAVGFPITLIMGMFIVYFGFTTFLGNYNRFIQEGFNQLRTLLNLG
ncbi:flagellar biosynthetic protein FliR [Simiduia agarivorans]|uniref:Flagellar biosynthetic protein FliR n=1 Tax=Simiduia agarivorans (strain DSM 21679 / JCM 13881 / BCRC 17597 / SA1) TaxID=1117647 RepID=K4KHQ5_SIMAS|nr:flagellar biosynthetic protein FliR [Simiduia agarivorans]AFU97700.1 flagellar biosynthetic protein FliR [Simiduia agarivorans SA1 = DSM 21679]